MERATASRADADGFEAPKLRRTDLFFTCRREMRDDGFGRYNSALRLCGRKRLR